VPSKDGLILTAPTVPDADIGREGYRTQLCRKALLSNDTGHPYSSRIHHALRGVEEYPQAAQSPAVRVVAPSVDRRQESWRYLLLSLCYATDQQFL